MAKKTKLKSTVESILSNIDFNKWEEYTGNVNGKTLVFRVDKEKYFLIPLIPIRKKVYHVTMKIDNSKLKHITFFRKSSRDRFLFESNMVYNTEPGDANIGYDSDRRTINYIIYGIVNVSIYVSLFAYLIYVIL